jgi:hypothetical protein
MVFIISLSPEFGVNQFAAAAALSLVKVFPIIADFYSLRIAIIDRRIA